VLTRVQLRFAHLELDLLRLDLSIAILGAHTGRGTFFVCVRCALGVGSDQICPPAFEGRADALVRGTIAMQIRPRSVALLLPEHCSPVVRLRRSLVPELRFLMMAR
jgi:hypothetical protein